MVAFGRVMRRWLRNSVAAAFIYWNRVVADLSALEDTRHHAAVLFEQALCRLARTSRGAAFAWWARVVQNMRRAEEAQERACALAGPSVESHGADLTSGSLLWWRGVVRQAQQTDTARGHAALLFEQALCRFARKSVQGAFAWWRHVLRLQDRHRAAARLFGQALCRLARSSEGASFVYWRGIVKQEIEAEARQRRSAAAMERVVRRFARMSVTGRSPGGATCVQTLWQRKNSGSWPRNSSREGWRCGPASPQRVPSTSGEGKRYANETNRGLVGTKVQNACGARSAASRRTVSGASSSDGAATRSRGSRLWAIPRERLHLLLRNAVLRWEHTTEAAAFGTWRRRTASYSSRELSLHFLERVVRRHAKKSLHTNLLAWRLRAKHTAVSAVAGAAKRRYEDFCRWTRDVPLWSPRQPGARKCTGFSCSFCAAPACDAGLWMLAGRHANSRKRALRRGFDACGRALRRFRVMNKCVRRLAHFHASIALNRWRVAAGARTRAIAALRAYGLHLNARGRADALRRSLATWRRACDGGALRLQLEARDAAAAGLPPTPRRRSERCARRSTTP